VNPNPVALYVTRTVTPNPNPIALYVTRTVTPTPNHARNLRENQLLDEEVDLASFAQRTTNFTGAELEGLVASAVSFALDRRLQQGQKEAEEAGNLSDAASVLAEADPEEDDASFKVRRGDFERALLEVTPSFGLRSMGMRTAGGESGVAYYGGRNHRDHQESAVLLDRLTTALADQEEEGLSPTTGSNRGCLLVGAGSGTGSTTMAVKAAVASGAPFVRVVTPKEVAGKSDLEACEVLAQHFHDTRESLCGVLVLDQIDEILGFHRQPAGTGGDLADASSSHNTAARQLIKAELRAEAAPGKNMLVLATTSDPLAIEAMALASAFDFVTPVPYLTQDEAVEVLEHAWPRDQGSDEPPSAVVREWYERGQQLGIKHILRAVELAPLKAKHSPKEAWGFAGALRGLATGAMAVIPNGLSQKSNS